jgi:hypothetical protein
MKIYWREILVRLLAVFAVVFLTYNPSGYSYVHWLAADGAGPLPLKVAFGIFLLILFYVLVTVTYGAFRLLGLITGAITAILFSVQALLFGLPESGLTTYGDYLLFSVYVVLMSVAIVIGFGITWSKFVSSLTGQFAKRYVRRAN